VWMLKDLLDKRLESTIHVWINFIDLSGIPSNVTFLAFSISTCPGNSAYKMQFTGSGSGLLNRASMCAFP
jgi:hypothetical protein